MGTNVLFDSTARLKVEDRSKKEIAIFIDLGIDNLYIIKFDNSIVYFFKLLGILF
jgi:hypothetical protein